MLEIGEIHWGSLRYQQNGTFDRLFNEKEGYNPSHKRDDRTYDTNVEQEDVGKAVPTRYVTYGPGMTMSHTVTGCMSLTITGGMWTMIAAITSVQSAKTRIK